jgi:hypothetical protein
LLRAAAERKDNPSPTLRERGLRRLFRDILGNPGRRFFAWNSLSKLGGKPDFLAAGFCPECPTAF